jgi:hypothetical protein
MPIATAKDPQPGTLNSGLIIGSSRMPAALIKLVLFKSSDAAKNGNKEGKTIFKHILMPFNAADTEVFGKKIRDSIKVIHSNGSIRCLR